MTLFSSSRKSTIDKYVASAKRIHISLLLLSFTVFYFSVQETLIADRIARASILTTIILSSRAAQDGLATTQLTRADLTKIYSEAKLDYMDVQSDYLQAQLHDRPESDVAAAKAKLDAFSQEALAESAFLSEFESRLSPRSYCVVAIFRGPDHKFVTIGSWMLKGFIYEVPLSNVYLVNYSDTCMPIVRDFDSIVLIDLRDREHGWQVGISERTLRRLSEDTLLRTLDINAFSLDEEDYFGNIPAIARQYLRIDPDYKAFPIEFYEKLVFQEARELTGYFRRPDELEEATSDLYQIQGPTASFYGVATSRLFFIQAGPVVFFLLSYLLYSRLQFINLSKQATDEPWVFNDIMTRLDYVFVYLWWLTPAVALVATYFVFADAQALGMRIGRFAITPRSFIGLGERPYLDAPGGAVIWLARGVLVLFLANLYLVSKVEWYLFRFIWTTRKRRRPIQD